MTDLSVIIVNYKVKPLLRRCLESVFSQTKGIAFEVFVVDNASGDGAVEMVRRDFPAARVIVNDRNLGFAAANNQALKFATGEFVVLLNPDTEVVADALSAMVAALRQRPNAGIAGPRVGNPDGSTQQSVRRFPTPLSQALLMLKLQHVCPNISAFSRYFAHDFDYAKPAKVDQVIGAVFFIRRSVLERLGPLDERYFIWFEEVDYCRQAVQAGFEVWYVPAATVIHHGGQSFGPVFGTKKQAMFNRSLRQYMAKHHGWAAAALILFLQPASMALAWLAAALQSRRSYDYAGSKKTH